MAAASSSPSAPSSRSSAFAVRPRAIRRSPFGGSLLRLQAVGAGGHVPLLSILAGTNQPRALCGKALVRVSAVAGDLLAEPGRRHEVLALSLRSELDLGRDQVRQLALVDVDLGFELAPERHPVAGLPQSPRLGQGPERVELVDAEIDLDLDPRFAVAHLHRQ